jgi:hypothetical protein
LLIKSDRSCPFAAAAPLHPNNPVNSYLLLLVSLSPLPTLQLPRRTTLTIFLLRVLSTAFAYATNLRNCLLNLTRIASFAFHYTRRGLPNAVRPHTPQNNALLCLRPPSSHIQTEQDQDLTLHRILPPCPVAFLYSLAIVCSFDDIPIDKSSGHLASLVSIAHPPLPGRYSSSPSPCFIPKNCSKGAGLWPASGCRQICTSYPKPTSCSPICPTVLMLSSDLTRLRWRCGSVVSCCWVL